MNDKENLFDILICEMNKNKITILHSDEFSVMNEKIIDRKTKEFKSINNLAFLDLAKLFLEINSRASFIQALNIAIKTNCYEYKEQRLLIHKILELAQKSGFFSNKEIYEMNFAAKPKCDECLAKESENE